jgi:hypothetical protein
MMTVNVTEVALPVASWAVQVTVVLPIGKSVLDPGPQATVGDPLTESKAEGVSNDTRAPDESGASTTTLAGWDMEGGVVSATMTRNAITSVRLPAVSEAVQTTAVVPIANTEPETGEQVGMICPSMSSMAVGRSNWTVEPVASSAST